MGDILKSISISASVAAYVSNEEVLRIYDGIDAEGKPKYECIDLQPFIDAGLLIVVSPESEAENITFVNFAAALGGDGEAVTGAIALHRGWSIGSDDRKATSFFSRHTPHLQVISTPELVKHWIDTAHPAFELVCTVLQKIQARARYEPNQKHYLYSWWQMHKKVQ